MRVSVFVCAVISLATMVNAGYRKYYEYLEIKSNAKDDEIRKAYRRLSVKYHPDKNKEAGAEERFQHINSAYEVLKDKDLRRVYDQEGEEGVKKYQ